MQYILCCKMSGQCITKCGCLPRWLWWQSHKAIQMNSIFFEQILVLIITISALSHTAVTLLNSIPEEDSLRLFLWELDPKIYWFCSLVIQYLAYSICSIISEEQMRKLYSWSSNSVPFFFRPACHCPHHLSLGATTSFKYHFLLLVH